MPPAPGAETADLEVDLLVAGLGPGGCAAALAARSEGLRTLAIDARGPQGTRSQLVLVRPGAQAALCELGLPDITEGRRTTTIRHVENRLRTALTTPGQTASGRSLAALEPCWNTSLAGLMADDQRVLATVVDDTGQQRRVAARHVIDASGGRLESLGRPARVRVGPSHWVITAEYAAPPWFEGIVGARDPATHELYLLFPTWGRQGVIAYLDVAPGPAGDGVELARRFEAIAHGLALGPPRYPPTSVDVFQRALTKPHSDRVVAIGDSVGTVDVLLGAGMSTAIEDGVDAVRRIAAAQREAAVAAELLHTREASASVFARHRSGTLRGRWLLRVRPILERAWPKANFPSLSRGQVGPPPLLWPAVRFVFGRRPQTS